MDKIEAKQLTEEAKLAYNKEIEHQIRVRKAQTKPQFIRVTRNTEPIAIKDGGLPIIAEVLLINVDHIRSIISTHGTTTLVLTDGANVYVRETHFQIADKIFWA